MNRVTKDRGSLPARFVTTVLVCAAVAVAGLVTTSQAASSRGLFVAERSSVSVKIRTSGARIVSASASFPAKCRDFQSKSYFRQISLAVPTTSFQSSTGRFRYEKNVKSSVLSLRAVFSGTRHAGKITGLIFYRSDEQRTDKPPLNCFTPGNQWSSPSRVRFVAQLVGDRTNGRR